METFSRHSLEAQHSRRRPRPGFILGYLGLNLWERSDLSEIPKFKRELQCLGARCGKWEAMFSLCASGRRFPVAAGPPWPGRHRGWGGDPIVQPGLLMEDHPRELAGAGGPRVPSSPRVRASRQRGLPGRRFLLRDRGPAPRPRRRRPLPVFILPPLTSDKLVSVEVSGPFCFRPARAFSRRSRGCSVPVVRGRGGCPVGDTGVSAWAPRRCASGPLLLPPGRSLGCAACPSSWDGCPAPWGEFEMCPCCPPFLPEAALGGWEACGSFLLGNAFIW